MPYSANVAGPSLTCDTCCPAKAKRRMLNIPRGIFLRPGLTMTSAFNAYAALALAIIFEVTASAFLQQSAQFTRPWPTLAMVLFYVASFYALSVAIRVIPLSIAYAIWGGVGIILTATVSFVLFRQMLDAAAFVGIALIVSGVVIINLFSQTTAH